MVGFDVLEPCLAARRPADDDLIRGRRVAEAEVDDERRRREEARARADETCLPPVAGAEADDRADRVAVRLRADELHLDPVPGGPDVPQELRRLTVTPDQEIE